MLLSKIVENIEVVSVEGSLDIDIASLVYDSRKVTEGALFVCMKGTNFDAHEKAGEVVESGAVALILEEDVDVKGVTIIKVKNSRNALALASAAWFDYPASKLTVIGITGTKGKTTTAHMIKSILEAGGDKVGMIGTMGTYIGVEKIPTQNTTPESYILHSLFNDMVNAGCKYVVMEASSQGFKMHRTDGIIFDYAAFLNISPDHISPEEHPDFEDYLDCKSVMFSQCREVIVNIDADRWQDALKRYEGTPHGISVKEKTDLYADNIKMIWTEDVLGISFDTHGDIEDSFELGIPGEFNVENALIAMEISLLAGSDIKAIKQGLKTVYVKGRTQLLKCATSITTMIIDYAHNALSMEELLKTLRAYNPERLVCLFGGGGNKPKARRYDMGSRAGKYADYTILTTDNPRNEDINAINAEIIEGIEDYNGKYEIIIDRTEAIHHLLKTAGKNDIIALIGKGHEEYQDIKGVKYHFSEQEVVEEYMKNYNA